MAEFKEVMKQARRMCETHTCGDCPLRTMECECRMCFPPGEIGNQRELEAIQRIVMDWAAKHPELRYPTWDEWWKREFPAADNAIYPCTFSIRERFACSGQGCETCRAQPIPADIAEKLGIKPIGGDSE